MSENNTEITQKALSLPWYEAKSEKGKFLPKHEGMNYYLVMKEPKAYETTTQTGRTFKSVNMEAKFLKATDLSKKTLTESPEKPYLGILSLSFAVSEDLVKYMKENSMPTKNLVGNVIMLMRLGTKLKTKYPRVELLSIEQFEQEFFKLKK